jgi:hypothetical protein
VLEKAKGGTGRPILQLRTGDGHITEEQLPLPK